MTHPFLKLDFIDSELKWKPKLSGNEELDYEFGYQCAYEYSATLIKSLGNNNVDDLMKDNETFRASINRDCPAGRGFFDGIRGLQSCFDKSG